MTKILRPNAGSYCHRNIIQFQINFNFLIILRLKYKICIYLAFKNGPIYMTHPVCLLVDGADRYELENWPYNYCKIIRICATFFTSFFTATCICYNCTKLAILFSFKNNRFCWKSVLHNVSNIRQRPNEILKTFNVSSLIVHLLEQEWQHSWKRSSKIQMIRQILTNIEYLQILQNICYIIINLFHWINISKFKKIR